MLYGPMCPDCCQKTHSSEVRTTFSMHWCLLPVGIIIKFPHLYPNVTPAQDSDIELASKQVSKVQETFIPATMHTNRGKTFAVIPGFVFTCELQCFPLGLGRGAFRVPTHLHFFHSPGCQPIGPVCFDGDSLVFHRMDDVFLGGGFYQRVSCETRENPNFRRCIFGGGIVTKNNRRLLNPLLVPWGFFLFQI